MSKPLRWDIASMFFTPQRAMSNLFPARDKFAKVAYYAALHSMNV